MTHRVAVDIIKNGHVVRVRIFPFALIQKSSRNARNQGNVLFEIAVEKPRFEVFEAYDSAQSTKSELRLDGDAELGAVLGRIFLPQLVGKRFHR